MKMSVDVKIDLLTTALYAGGLYALLRIVITQFYPLLINLWWQGALGQIVASRWPLMVQSEDISRLSYLPEGDNPSVITFSYRPDFDDLTHGIRDGMCLGLLLALLPEIFAPTLMTILILIVIAHGVFNVTAKQGAFKTDAIFVLCRRLLMWAAVLTAVSTAGFIG